MANLKIFNRLFCFSGFMTLLIININAQVPPFFTNLIDCIECMEESQGNSSFVLGCTNQSALYNDYSFYMIDQNSNVKTVRLNFIFVQKDDGTGNFCEDNFEHQSIISDIIDLMNTKMANLNVANCGGANIHSKIQFEVNMIYMQDTYLWNNDNDTEPYKCPNRTTWYLKNTAQLIDNDPLVPKGIDIFFTNGLTA